MTTSSAALLGSAAHNVDGCNQINFLRLFYATWSVGHWATSWAQQTLWDENNNNIKNKGFVSRILDSVDREMESFLFWDQVVRGFQFRLSIFKLGCHEMLMSIDCVCVSFSVYASSIEVGFGFLYINLGIIDKGLFNRLYFIAI